MSSFSIEYLGELRTKITHLDSGQSILTDAPKDNQGLGRTFSPTDLAASSLGSCMLTIIGITAKTHKIKINNMSSKVLKVMSKTIPRKIAEIQVILSIEGYLNKKFKTIIERSAKHCPVHKSLHRDVNISTTFNYKIL